MQRLAAALLLLASATASGQRLLVEAESFDEHGGWKLDTQSIEVMGSPYMLAHGLGRPVEDATTRVTFPETGSYHVHVRTKDWVARWRARPSPGRFRLLVGGLEVPVVFGTEGVDWNWHYGGRVDIRQRDTTLTLRDLTGFDGRCDAIYFSKDRTPPPADSTVLAPWRRQLLGLPEHPLEESGFDLVVVGGGYSGMGAALSAARMGCRVALIQNRPVLGGNGSSEIRVWSMGLVRRGPYPRLGEIVEEFCDQAKRSPGTYEEFGDRKKEAIVRAEKNIRLFLNHHAHAVDTKSGHIEAVHAFDTRTGAHRRFTGRLFVDATGHGTIGFLAGADWEMTPKGRMGMSNMWAWAEADGPVAFPETPWALDLEMEDFPYPRNHHGPWYWESGYDKDPIKDAEGIRDWNLRAVFGAFNAMKNRGGKEKHENAHLTWIAYIGGPRESRRLMGDVVLTQDDIVTKRRFPDGCVPSTWSIDLHYPKKQYAKKYPDNPFIAIAVHDRRIDRAYGYPVPYRCFYSRNIDNLFMAGRCISVTHEALGTTRVMKTCGMMGEVVGRAAAVCVQEDCLPRDVHAKHFDELAKLMHLPGKARRARVGEEITIPEDVPSLPPKGGAGEGLDPAGLAGLVVDDRAARKTGRWTEGTGLANYIGWSYLYANADSGASATFSFKAPESGTFDVRLAYQPHENRGPKVPVTLEIDGETRSLRLDMRKKPPIGKGFISLGHFAMTRGEAGTVTVSTEGAGGYVHADAIQVVKLR